MELKRGLSETAAPPPPRRRNMRVDAVNNRRVTEFDLEVGRSDEGAVADKLLLLLLFMSRGLGVAGVDKEAVVVVVGNSRMHESKWVPSGC